MELTPWTPFKDIGPFKKEMDRLWSQFFGDASSNEISNDVWLPAMDISENDDSLIVEAELPGMDAEDIEVNLSGDLLTIKGKNKKERIKEGENYHLTECHVGSFQRSFRLPTSVQSDKIDAKFEKGLLRITMQKSEEAREKLIKVKVH